MAVGSLIRRQSPAPRRLKPGTTTLVQIRRVYELQPVNAHLLQKMWDALTEYPKARVNTEDHESTSKTRRDCFYLAGLSKMMIPIKAVLEDPFDIWNVRWCSAH